MAINASGDKDGGADIIRAAKAFEAYLRPPVDKADAKA